MEHMMVLRTKADKESNPILAYEDFLSGGLIEASLALS